jgi:tRNA-specific 2-thiouridylase
MEKVVVGLSGGIDSSFALYLLKEIGFKVIGVSMKIWDGSDVSSSKKKGGCFGPKEEEEIKDAEKVCRILDVPFYVFDLSKEYKRDVLDYVKKEYTAGRTPNPCVLCNRKIKFGLLLKFVAKSGISFDFFATGHYARIEKIKESYFLKKGIDEKKDQSYFLWKLQKEQIKNILFPLGNWKKEDVKKEAKKLKFPALDKPESQDFFEGDLEFLIPKTKKGPIKDLKGNILGEHKGISHYTIGQRRGLGISFSEPLYVVKIDPKENTIFVGTKKDCFQKKFSVFDLNWVSIDEPKEEIECFVKVRYKHNPAKAKVNVENGKAIVEFEEPQLSITPGQSTVFYDGDVLLGGGIIDFVYE